MSNHSKKLQLKVHGTHCASCEVLIERSLMKLPGVEKVHVNFANGKTDIFASRTLELSEIQRSIQGGGYSVSRWDDRHTGRVSDAQENGPRKYVEIGAIFLLLFGTYLMLKQFDLVPADLGVTDTMSYGFVFIIGLVAALSTCLAVAGGLLLAAAAKYNDLYPNLTGYQKFKPTLYFNIGRVVSYTVFGGLIGALGSVISLSSRGTGILTIIASLVMIILGFQLLHF